MGDWFDRFTMSPLSAKKKLEDKRKKGEAVTGSEMNPAMQGALGGLVKEDQSRGLSAEELAEQEHRRRQGKK